MTVEERRAIANRAIRYEETRRAGYSLDYRSAGAMLDDLKTCLGEIERLLRDFERVKRSQPSLFSSELDCR